MHTRAAVGTLANVSDTSLGDTSLGDAGLGNTGSDDEVASSSRPPDIALDGLGDVKLPQPPTDGPDPLVDAVLAATRALVGVAARSLALLGEEVTLPQFRALVILATQGGQRLAELAQALGVDPSTATRMCDRLVRKELVHRRRTNDDRRGVRISLAPAGRELVDQVTQRRRAEIAEILARLDADRCEQVLSAMDAFAQAAGEPPPDGWALGWSTTAPAPGSID